MKLLKLPNKGQVSFELLVIMAVIILLSGVFMSDFFNEYSDSMVLLSVKTFVNQEISLKTFENASCSFTRLEKMSFHNTSINIDLSGDDVCFPLNKTIADMVEVKQCGFNQGDGNSNIRCGTKIYGLNIS